MNVALIAKAAAKWFSWFLINNTPNGCVRNFLQFFTGASVSGTRNWTNDDPHEAMASIRIILQQRNVMVVDNASVDTKSVQGIAGLHAYSLLWYGDLGDGIELVQCRNPWGKAEWGGDWSDTSDLWDEHPEVAQKRKITGCICIQLICR